MLGLERYVQFYTLIFVSKQKCNCFTALLIFAQYMQNILFLEVFHVALCSTLFISILPIFCTVLLAQKERNFVPSSHSLQ